MFSLTTPMNAGTRVSAASMVIATVIAAARPSAPTNATSEMYRPRIEMTTVLPATTIAAPDVPSACLRRGEDVHPGVQLLAVPGDQEQAVVDRDAEAEQGGDRRRGGGKRQHRREQAKQGQARARR